MTIKKNETALITGASSGIGLALANIMAKEGYDLFLVARNKAALEELTNKLKTIYQVNVNYLAIDLSLATAPDEIYLETKALSITIDMLVNNAGFGDFGFFKETDWLKEKMMLDVNITALTALCKLYVKDMVIRKKGKSY